MLLPRPVLVAGVAAVLFSAGCTAHRAGSAAGRFVKAGTPKTEYPVEILGQGVDTKLRDQELAVLREQALRTGPPARPLPPTLESTDPELTQALRELQRAPSAARHLAVAEAYRRLGIRDLALEHYAAAQTRDRRLAAAYDGSARVWRDAKRLDFALADVSRAAYYAPRSPEVQNTLGTILMAAGNVVAAQRAFARALDLDPAAEYARRNLELAVGENIK